MLVDGDFAIELAIFEDGMPPEFRIFASKSGQALSPESVNAKVTLTRLGDVTDNINFRSENNYLRGDMEIYEPHSFAVTVSASYQGKHYQWQYDNFEGRTKIVDAMAQKMDIATEFVAAQEFNESLKVFGKLTLPANAIRHISARYPGLVKQLNVVLGQRVKKGQLLATIESNESLQSYKVYAPISGIITSQNTNTGEQAGNDSLLTISNTNKLIAELAVFPMDVSKVKLGSAITLTMAGVEQPITSQLFDSLIAVNQQQAKIFRAEVDNRQGLFNVGQFVEADIALANYQVAKAVKADGLQSFRDFTVVYAKVGEQYEVRMLELGRKAGPWVEVLGGIDAGTEYVAQNSYLLKADIDKSAASHDH